VDPVASEPAAASGIPLGIVAARCGAALSPPETAGVRATGVAYDSRRVAPGDLFCALSGVKVDGTVFVRDALARGAVAVLHGGAPLGLSGAAELVADDPRRAMGLAAAAIHGDPSRRMDLVGVTGTNGKSSTCSIFRDLACACGRPAALFGTIRHLVAGKELPAARTMPEAPDTMRMLAEALRAGEKTAVMEVSSQGIAAERHAGLVFSVGVFTHLTRDHLDFHGDMERYYLAKRRLFEESLAPGRPVVAGSDGWSARLVRECGAGRPVFRFAVDGEGTHVARDVVLTTDGTRFRLTMPAFSGDVSIPFAGRHNVENVLAALAAGTAVGLGAAAMVAALPRLSPVAGRLERVADPVGGRKVYVDYAHTPDALSRVLAALRAVAGGKKIVCLVGCGGDRDRGKRPQMGQAACEGADEVVFTSDNPRSEDPEAILRDILSGVPAGAACRVVPDRAQAIREAVALAGPGDVVLLAGKGHESEQIVGSEIRPFSDRDEARAALAERGNA
jgi:UDP-N-acetylmuramoyl-L-alanyl-D-glutamate--2,6-diaminopimelate ligase